MPARWNMTSSFIPGANPNAIQMSWAGVTSLATDPQGNLDLGTAGGTVVENAPLAYQTTSGEQHQLVAISYRAR